MALLFFAICSCIAPCHWSGFDACCGRETCSGLALTQFSWHVYFARTSIALIRGAIIDSIGLFPVQAALKSPKQVYSDYASRADASITLPDLSAVMKLYEERMPSVPGICVVLYFEVLVWIASGQKHKAYRFCGLHSDRTPHTTSCVVVLLACAPIAVLMTVSLIHRLCNNSVFRNAA